MKGFFPAESCIVLFESDNSHDEIEGD